MCAAWPCFSPPRPHNAPLPVSIRLFSRVHPNAFSRPSRSSCQLPRQSVITNASRHQGRSMSQSPETKEPQYSLLYDVKEKYGIARLGLMVNESWNQDPKRTLFTLARYKFVARMLAGRKHVLEVGCADAFGTRIVQQAVGKRSEERRVGKECRTGWAPRQ